MLALHLRGQCPDASAERCAPSRISRPRLRISRLRRLVGEAARNRERGVRRRRRKRSKPVGLTLYYALMLWASFLRRAGNAGSAKGGLASRADLAPRDVPVPRKQRDCGP